MTALGLLGVAFPVFGLEGIQHVSIAHEVTRLIVQLGVIILAAKAAGSIAKRLKLPSLLGEVTAGLVLSPYALGSVALPGFSDGLVPLAVGPFSVSVQLYGFAAVGAVIHILAVGLESDPNLFARMRPRGIAIAVGSSAAALFVGVLVPVVVMGFEIGDRRVLFFAALSVSTSLGVQARIMSSQHRIGTPEGAAIVGSSLLQDGLAIIVLAIAMAVGPIGDASESAVTFTTALPVALIALGVLIGGFILVVVTAPRVARSFRDHGSPTVFAIIAIAITLIVSGVFETFGVAAIIGAYLMGLAFSRTDVADVLEEKIAPVSAFFVPVLYVVMGMLIDFRVLLTPEVLLPGIAFAVLSGGAKIIGAGIPALATGFNRWGALRVGLGTVPRGEIALIIAAVGLAGGFLSPSVFKIMAVMVVFSVAIGSPAIAAAFRNRTVGTRGEWGSIETAVTALDLPSEELTELITAGILRAAEQEGFFVHRLELAETLYRMRRDDLFLSLRRTPRRIEIESAPGDAGIAKTLLYEVVVHVRDRVGRITEVVVPEELRRDVAAGAGKRELALAAYLDESCIVIPLAGQTKEDAIRELVARLDAEGKLLDHDHVLAAVLEREASVSTGMENGIAIPHAKTDGVSQIAVAVGVSREGIEFNSIDEKPAHLVFLIASPIESRGPHLQLLASIATHLRDEDIRSRAVEAQSAQEFIAAIL